MSVNFTSLRALAPELVNQLKERLPDPLFEELNTSLRLSQEEDFLVDGALPLHELGNLVVVAWKDEDVGGYVVRQLV